MINVSGGVGCCNPKCFEEDLAALCPDPKLREIYFQRIVNNEPLDSLIATYEGKGRRTFDSFRRAAKAFSSTSTLRSTTASSRRNVREMIVLKTMILQRGPHQIIHRRRLVREIASGCSLRRALSSMCSNVGANLTMAKVYHSVNDSFNDADLSEIDMKKYGDNRVVDFPSATGEMCFAIDFAEYIHGRNRPILI
ncbi:hypothetical protein AB6A40_001492 [Gnathostoma spinigerum]|uniref:Uncharacterized protein n=1 Tax=Gnathostoma spinigerum TaxID=75299 RepID=A0ABD6E4A2_9BILA